MDLPTALLPGLVAALGLGMLIGIERERRKGEEEAPAAAGVRTHALLALLGAVAQVLGPWMLASAALGVVALAVASYLRTSAEHPGVTGEIAMLLTFWLGALAMQQPLLAAALGVAVAVLLASRQWLHHLTRELISEREMRDLLLLAATLLIVVPLLPDRPIDPWKVLVPSALGQLVAMVMAIGAAGHVALRLIGARWGLPVAGFFAGFASSTAATAGFGQRVQETPGLRTAAVAAALFANLASLLLFALVIGAAAPALLGLVRWPLLAAGTVLLAGALLGLWHAPRDPRDLPSAPQARAFRLGHALTFAAVVAGVLLVSAWLQRVFGDAGALVAATLAALAELHAAAASLAQLSRSGGLTPEHARWGVLALLAASVASKSVVAVVSGGAAYGLRVALGLLAMLVAAAGVLWLLPSVPA
ncbi:MAG: DUF4010 domain-containing protein [Chiayiivirga sp.]|jgi:uncharacterized membrane protein (DUF4010 family)|uniref:MgtC/SapB family protein n=1 Tax=Chiayiivirga sp. TaxID=2041042 RepID=UPI0025BCE0C5|nr:DUF4010 domain-containing protein [Chiayiivirga sp.]MCI1711241.1 DUF4010 domain-containing protein [Chiayiivirga sp.]MCI1727959.1 DUF4010 domain-containing protein [Chiayiivirga sp.]